MKRITLTVLGLAAVVLALGSARPATAAPLCSDAGVFPVPLSTFTSCSVQGGGPAGQDNLPNVQAALDLALEPNILLEGTGSFCPGPGCTGSEFTGSNAADGFIINPASVGGSNTFTFEQIPPGTLFISLKQGNGFEVFRVPSSTPFDLTHMLGNSTSHISTFVAIPEPTTLSLVLFSSVLGLAGRRAVRRRLGP